LRSQLEKMKVSPEELAVVGLIDGLPAEMAGIKDILLAKETLVFGDIAAVVREKCDQIRRTEVHNDPMVLQASVNQAVAQAHANAAGIKCYRCGKAGHYSSECYTELTKEQVLAKGKGKARERSAANKVVASIVEAL
jgi:hypothetical protein